jgi:hypothetical protein
VEGSRREARTEPPVVSVTRIIRFQFPASSVVLQVRTSTTFVLAIVPVTRNICASCRLSSQTRLFFDQSRVFGVRQSGSRRHERAIGIDHGFVVASACAVYICIHCFTIGAAKLGGMWSNF